MQGWWRTVLRLRFFYLRELLLGVLVWERMKFADNNYQKVGFNQKNKRGDQAGVSNRLINEKSQVENSITQQPNQKVASTPLDPITIVVKKQAQEQEIFSSDKYQKSVSRGLMVELPVDDAEMVDDTELVDAKISSWTAVSVMLDKRKKKLAFLPVTEDHQNDRQDEVGKIVAKPISVVTMSQDIAKKPTEPEIDRKGVIDLKSPAELVDADKFGQKRDEQFELIKTTVPIVLPEKDIVVADAGRSTILDLSRPSRRQFLLDLMPVGLRSKLIFKQEDNSEMLKQTQILKQVQDSSPARAGSSVQHDRKRVRIDKKSSGKSETLKQVQGDGQGGSRKTKKSLSYWLSWLMIAGGILIAIIFVVPDLYFRLAPVDVIKLGEVKGSQNDSPTEDQVTPTPTPTPYVPPIDPDLPAGQWLIIPEIGVKTQPQATEDPEIALKDGVWIAPDYGQIGQPGMPIIMAAHRFGWKWWWQSDYWKLNSFYNLPETKEGTIVELIADQRKWTYLIYGGEEGDAITDYGADLILYTCKFLNSPIRHVRYARLIDPTRPELVLNQDNRQLSDEEKTELGKLFSLPY